MPPSRRTKKRVEIVKLFAERLREVRLSRGLTQVELASQAKVSPTHISELENGDIAPGIDLVDRLAQALGTSVAGLFATSEDPDPLPVLKEQARRLLDILADKGDRESFLRLNPFLAMLVEAVTKRR